MDILTFIFIIPLTCGKLLLLTDFIFRFIVFQNTFAEAAVLVSGYSMDFRTAENRIRMLVPPLSNCSSLSM